jgi:hypothetical protein
MSYETVRRNVYLAQYTCIVIRVLDSIASAKVAWSTPAEISLRLSMELEMVNSILCTLQCNGWIVPWEVSDFLAVTLTPWAAEILDVEIVEVGPDLIPRFMPIAGVDEKPIRAGSPIRDYYRWDLGGMLAEPKSQKRSKPCVESVPCSSSSSPMPLSLVTH